MECKLSYELARTTFATNAPIRYGKSLGELKKYGVFAKVDIVDASKNWRVTAGLGKAIEAEIIRVFNHWWISNPQPIFRINKIKILQHWDYITLF